MIGISRNRMFALAVLLLFGLQGLALQPASASTSPVPDAIAPYLVPCPPPDDRMCVAPSPAFGHPGTATWEDYRAPATLPGHNNAGEPTLGISWKTDNVMFKAGLNTYRVVFDENTLPANAIWSDVTPEVDASAVINLDPMLHTDPITGRTFTGGLMGPCSSMSYSDDDGQNWIPMALPCPMGAGFDHQSVGSGPYRFDEDLVGMQRENLDGIIAVDPDADEAAQTIYPHAVYYCAQNVADACSVSIDGGETFSPLIQPAPCALHGHIQVGPDGTMYLPHTRCADAGFQYAYLTGHHYSAEEEALLGADPGDDVIWGWDSPPCFDDNSYVDPMTAPTPPEYPQYDLLCGSGSFDPSLDVSKGNEFLYFAQAEDNGVWVGKIRTENIGKVPVDCPTYPAALDCWESIGHGNVTTGLFPAPDPEFRPGPYIDIGKLAEPRILEAEFVDVLAGDADRAVVTFLGSTQNGTMVAGGAPIDDGENHCGAGADIHEWHYYAAWTFNGGQNWNVQKLTDHPVQIGGINDDGFTAGEEPQPCRELLDFNDADLDSEGRVHIAYADGCLPFALPTTGACNPGSSGAESRNKWASILRQTTGCGLFAEYDKPYPNACDHEYFSPATPPGETPDIDLRCSRGFWIDPECDVPSARAPGVLEVTSPSIEDPVLRVHKVKNDRQDIIYDAWKPPPIVIEGTVTRNDTLDDLVATIDVPDTVRVGEAFSVSLTSLSGGSGYGVCEWSGDRDTRLLFDQLCAGAGGYINVTGQHRIRLDVVDLADPQLRTSVSQVVNVLPPRVSCNDKPLVVDPEHDVGLVPGSYLQDEKVLEGENHDIRRICVREVTGGEMGEFQVRMQVAKLHELNVGGTAVNEKFNDYGVGFCLDNNGPPVCYYGRTWSDGGARQWEAGVVPNGFHSDGGIIMNPAVEDSAEMCPDNSLFAATPGGLDLENSEVVFNFRRGAPEGTFNYTYAAPATIGTATCADLVHAGRGEINVTTGTVLSNLTGGSIGRIGTGASGAVEEMTQDFTHAETGPRLNHRFNLAAPAKLEAEGGGVYFGTVHEPIDVNAYTKGGSREVRCLWTDPENDDRRANKNFMNVGGVDSWLSCDAAKAVFDEPGVYRLDFNAFDLTGGRRPLVLDADRDPTLFVILEPDSIWTECLDIQFNGKHLTGQCRRKTRDPATGADIPQGVLIDSRYGTVEWRVEADLAELTNTEAIEEALADGDVIEAEKRFNKAWEGLRTGLFHELNITYWDHGTAVETSEPGTPTRNFTQYALRYVDIVEPGTLDSRTVTVNDPTRPLSGVNERLADFDWDEDGIADGIDFCVAYTSKDQKDNCDPDWDRDGVPNDRDNCISVANAVQEDSDANGVGDACQDANGDGPDLDDDGEADHLDNCPFIANADQADQDGDGHGDTCDVDIDGDGVPNLPDAYPGCQYDAQAAPYDPFPCNAREWRDTDRDGIGDNADNDDDGDGAFDEEELARGTDPLNALDFPLEGNDREKRGPLQAANVAGGGFVLWAFLVVVLVLAVVLALLWMPRKE